MKIQVRQSRMKTQGSCNEIVMLPNVNFQFSFGHQLCVFACFYVHKYLEECCVHCSFKTCIFALQTRR